MKALYFDCFAGVSGDMVLGSLIDSGLDLRLIEHELGKLELSGYSLSATKTIKNGITGTAFRVDVLTPQPSRNYRDIISLINSSKLDAEVIKDACEIFTIIARAEAQVHSRDINSVHFHEIGAVDSIIDICGTAIAMKEAGIQAAFCSAINTGSGTVKTAHGILPVPAPATALLLEGMTVYSTGTQAELATPTGAAILKRYCAVSSSLPPMELTASGYGAGSLDLEFPNMLRLFRGTIKSGAESGEKIIELETNIDDMNPELFTHIFDSLFTKGAIDVTVIPALMKKNRPGHILKVLAAPDSLQTIARELFRETTSSGIRFREISRFILERKLVEVTTEFGPVRVKVHSLGGETVTVSPEYEDCRRQAAAHNAAVKTVYNAAVASYCRTF